MAGLVTYYIYNIVTDELYDWDVDTSWTMYTTEYYIIIDNYI